MVIRGISDLVAGKADSDAKDDAQASAKGLAARAEAYGALARTSSDNALKDIDQALSRRPKESELACSSGAPRYTPV